MHFTGLCTVKMSTQCHEIPACAWVGCIHVDSAKQLHVDVWYLLSTLVMNASYPCWLALVTGELSQAMVTLNALLLMN